MALLCGGRGAALICVCVGAGGAGPAREEMMAAMALGALVLGVPHFEGSTTPSLAPKTGEAPAHTAAADSRRSRVCTLSLST